MARDSIGEQEMALLKYVAAAGGVTAGQAAEGFGGSQGLARSTVLTMLERLRRKGHLRRERVAGVFRYSSQRTQQELLTGAVKSFVERTLSGSVSPFVAYLAEGAELSDADLEELEQLVTRLQAERGEAER